MVRAVPGVPGPARPPRRRPARPPRGATRPTTRFLLDGQTVVVDDYLEVRPEAEARLARARRRRARADRAVDGPHGRVHGVGRDHRARPAARHRTRATQLGGAMRRRLPPRHVRARRADAADPAPRRARARGRVAGRARARSIAPRSGGSAPDGSRVRAEYLYGSYSNGRDLPADPDAARGAGTRLRAELGAAALPGGGMLLMNGSDHLPPAAVVGRRRRGGERDAGTSTTSRSPRSPSTSRAQPTDGLPTWCGELRSGARANVLMGVASNRVDVHQAAAAAERSARTPRRAAERAVRPARPRTRARCSTSAGATWCSTARTTRRARAARRGRRGGAGALPGGAPHRRGAGPRRARRPWPTRSTPRRRRPSS